MDATTVNSPAWLTKEYMEDKLRKRYNEPNLILTDLKVKPGSSKGDNYTSVMLRIQVTYQLSKQSPVQTESLIVKSTFSGDSLAARTLGGYGMYKREMFMYQEILPKLEAILKEGGEVHKIYPKTIFVDYTHDSIIFEDLTGSGFTMADRLARLDETHTHLTLTKLAKFHAAAAVLHERTPELFAENFDCGLFNRRTRGFQPMVNGILRALIRYIDTQPILREKYLNKLQNLDERVMEYCERTFDVEPLHFMTLAHGDCWHTNMMFKYTDDTSKVQSHPIDHVFLDFQCCVWASPMIDLQYFFNTSLREELRLQQQSELFQFYYEALKSTLIALKFKGPIPSLFQLRIQMELRSFYGLFAALFFQPIMICPATEDSDFNNLMSDTESGIRLKETLFKNVEVQKYIERLLPIYDKMGLLDNMDAEIY